MGWSCGTRTLQSKPVLLSRSGCWSTTFGVTSVNFSPNLPSGARATRGAGQECGFPKVEPVKRPDERFFPPKLVIPRRFTGGFRPPRRLRGNAGRGRLRSGRAAPRGPGAPAALPCWRRRHHRLGPMGARRRTARQWEGGGRGAGPARGPLCSAPAPAGSGGGAQVPGAAGPGWSAAGRR